MRVAVPCVTRYMRADGEEPCCAIRRKRDRVQRPILWGFYGRIRIDDNPSTFAIAPTKAV